MSELLCASVFIVASDKNTKLAQTVEETSGALCCWRAKCCNSRFSRFLVMENDAFAKSLGKLCFYSAVLNISCISALNSDVRNKGQHMHKENVSYKKNKDKLNLCA